MQSDATPAPRAGTFGQGLWRLADPKISITSAAAMAIAIGATVHDGELHRSWLVVTAVALFCMEVAKNAWGDVFDYDSGTDLAVAPEDRTGFSGGKRVLVDALLTRRQTWGIALAFGSAGVLLGALIVFVREPAAFWIGTLGLALGWSYHGTPLKFAYRGLGELDVVLCYGPVLTLSTYLIQTHRLSWDVFWLSMPLGLLIAAFLWVNEFPDFLADRQCGKNNLVVRLGRRRASRLLPLIHLAAYAILLALPWSTSNPALVLLGLLACPLSVYACVRTWQDPDGFYRHDPVQPASLLAFVVYASAVCTGLILA